MAYTPEAIANYFIGLQEPTSGLTPMKIQKLVYFANGWHLALKDAPLINEEIQAWDFGPVVERLYHALKEHGDTPVTEPIIRLKARPGVNVMDAIEEHTPSIDDVPESKEFTKALLNKVWKNYGKYSAIQLSKMTHSEGTPWDQNPQPISEVPSEKRSDSERNYPEALQEPTIGQSIDLSGLTRIPEPQAAPSSEPDLLSTRECLTLSPDLELKYHHLLLVQRLDQQIKALETRCSRQQLDIDYLRPRVAELEQAENVARSNTNMVAIGWAIGGTLVSASGYFFESLKWLACGAGGSMVIWACISTIVTNRNVWAKTRKSPFPAE